MPNTLPIAIFSLLMILLQLVSAQGLDSVVVEFQPDRVASVNSFLLYSGKVPEMKKFSSCFRINVEQVRDGMPVVSYSTPTFDNDLLLFVKRMSVFELSCCNDATIKFTDEFVIKLLDWNSLCISMDFDSKEYTLVINGNVTVRNKKILENVNDPKITGGGMLYLGQEQDTFGGTLNRFQSIRGKLADLFLIASSLSESEMIDFTSCRINSFDTDDIVFDLHNASDHFRVSDVNIYNVEDLKSLCKSGERRRVILTDPRMAEDAFKTCNIVGGTMTAPRDEEDNWRLFNLTSQYSKECLKANTDIIWLGMIRDEEKKDLVYIGSKEVVTYRNLWGQFKLTSEEPCMSFYGVLEDSPQWYGKWDDTVCDADKCSPCEFQRAELLKMRGLCKKSYFDRHYYVIRENQSTVFLGDKFSAIHKLPPDYSTPNDYGNWEIMRYDMPEVRAIMKMEVISHLPTGKNSWDISNDRCGVMKSDLVLTICAVGEFSCADGSCIPLTKRCNLETNCPDASDEDDCLPLILPTKYSPKISPPRESPTTPVKIDIYVEIFAVRAFELANFRIVTENVITTTWIDKRIKFKNLKLAETLNNMQASDSKPWIPTFQFLGGGNTTSDVEERKVSLLARRMSDPLPDDDQNFSEDEIFRGADNPLVMKNKVTVATACTFELAFFPFDRQYCNIIILMVDTTSNYALFAMNNESVSFMGERKLLEYYVTSVRNETYDQGLFSGIKIEIIFDNLYMYYMTSTFIPTLIMLVIGGSTFYFPLDDFTDRIMVALTSLLVEATFFSQVTESIPKTAYLKFIDIWFVFCILDLFVIYVALTVVNYFYYQEDRITTVQFSPVKIMGMRKQDLAVKMNRVLEIIFPVSLTVFVLIYSLFAITITK